MTYLSAKNAGFAGSFDDWVVAGRPEGETSNSIKNLNIGGKIYQIDYNDIEVISRNNATGDVVIRSQGQTIPVGFEDFALLSGNMTPEQKRNLETSYQSMQDNLTFGNNLANQIAENPASWDIGTAQQNMTPEQINNLNISQNTTGYTSESLDQIAQMIADAIGVLTPAEVTNLTPDDIENIQKKIEDEFGPYFTELRERAEYDFNEARKFAEENLRTIFSDTESDVGEGRKRLARNYSEAMMDTQMAMANRGLTRGFAREEAEGRLRKTGQEQLRDLETQAQRTMRDQQEEFARQFGSGALPNLSIGTSDIQERFYEPWQSGSVISPKTATETGTEVTAQERRLEDLLRERDTTYEEEQRAKEQELFNTYNPQLFNYPS